MTSKNFNDGIRVASAAPLVLRIAALLVMLVLLLVEAVYPNWLSGSALVCLSVVLLAYVGATPQEHNHARVRIRSDTAGFETRRRR